MEYQEKKRPTEQKYQAEKNMQESLQEKTKQSVSQNNRAKKRKKREDKAEAGTNEIVQQLQMRQLQSQFRSLIRLSEAQIHGARHRARSGFNV